MNKRFSIFALALSTTLSMAFSLSAYGHHSSAPHFDSSKEVNVAGTITELKLVNPHAYVYFDVTEAGETANWRCELSSATQLKRWGWSKELFAPGQTIEVTGTPARREDNVCFLKSIKLENGMVIARSTDLTKDVEATAVEVATVKSERSLYLENGQPNLQGPWITQSFGRNAQGIRANFVASELGKAAAEGYDMAFDDPILQCHFVNMFDGWNHDENVNDITQTDDTITLQYGFMDVVRTIHLNMDEHPADITPSSVGHSIGKWDGDVLVVDTIGFAEGVLSHRNGTKHSEQMHGIERFRYEPTEQRLYRDYRVTDPLYLVGETRGQDIMALSPAPYTPYGCVELSGNNNIRPTDSRYQTLDDADASILPANEPAQDTPWWQFWD